MLIGKPNLKEIEPLGNYKRSRSKWKKNKSEIFSFYSEREREKGSLIEMGGVEGKVVVVYGNKRQGEKREEAQNPPTKKKNNHDRPKTIGNWNRQMMRNEERNKSRR